MPKLITSAEQFEELKSKASECRVVRSDRSVKLKLRTPSFLYTYVTTPDEANDLIKSLKGVEVIEFTAPKKGEEKQQEGKKKEESEETG
jgi:hypothetical protein